MIIELGRLTRDVILKSVSTSNGKRSVVNNCLAINHNKASTTFIDITALGKTAEIISQHLTKGDEVYIEGELHNKKQKHEDYEYTVPYIVVSRIKQNKI